MTEPMNDEFPLVLGAGWVEAGDAGYAAVHPTGAAVPLPAQAQRSLAVTDVHTARELAEAESRETDRLESLAFRAAHSAADCSLAGVLAAADRRAATEDARAASIERNAALTPEPESLGEYLEVSIGRTVPSSGAATRKRSRPRPHRSARNAVRVVPRPVGGGRHGSDPWLQRRREARRQAAVAAWLERCVAAWQRGDGSRIRMAGGTRRFHGLPGRCVMPLAPREPATPPAARVSVLEGAVRPDQSGIDATDEARAAQAAAEAAGNGILSEVVTLPPVAVMYGFAEGVTGPPDPAA